MREKLVDLYFYDETSPTFLRWNTDIFSGRYKNQKNVSKGDVAGGIGNSGYYQVRCHTKLVLVHRVIYELHFGEIPDNMFIDHIDGDRTNNKIDNLRLVERVSNARNCRLRKDSTSGKVGVNYCKNKQRSGNYTYYWRSVWVDLDGKTYTKAFNISKYGDELAKFLAEEYRQNQIDLLNLQNAGYTQRHGKIV